jgi:oligopeptide transport system permease protein
MTDAALDSPATLPAQSPARRAFRRFVHDRGAVAGLAALLGLALICTLGPLFAPHGYDQVFRDYVKVPPSLVAHPTRKEQQRIVGRVAARLGASATEITSERGASRFALQAPAPIDEAALLDPLKRSDAFADAQIAARQDDGRKLTIVADLRHETFLFGADSNGRDLLTRILVGGRVSLLVGVLASAVALIIGVAYGAIAGYAGGRLDAFMMRLVDILYALPFMFFVILLIVTFGRHFALVFVAIGAVEWLDMARIVRGQALGLKHQDYVLAAEALGASAGAIIRRHIVPNLVGPVIAFLTLIAARVILLESFLSFLGLGVQEPMTSLGALIADGARNIEDAPGLLVFPAATLTILLFALNLVGEGLRNALDPRALKEGT